MARKHSGIMIVIGTKAELIKCMPIMKLLQERNEDYWFVSTGQHPLSEMSKEFDIKQPDLILTEEPEISTKFWSIIDSNSFFWNLAMPFIRYINGERIRFKKVCLRK